MFAGEIATLHGKYEELRLQLHQKDVELIQKDILGKESLRLMLQALERNLEAKMEFSISSISERRGEEQYNLLAKQITLLTAKIDSNPEELLKLWQGVEQGRIEVDNLGNEVSRYFARIENLERNWQKTQEEWHAKFEALMKQRMAAEAEGKDVINFFNVRDVCGSFVGREEELVSLEHYFAKHVRGIQVIGGFGGLGKTQITLQYVEQHREHYGDKIRWIMAETEATIGQSFRDFADDLGMNTENLTLAEVEI